LILDFGELTTDKLRDLHIEINAQKRELDRAEARWKEIAKSAF